MTETNNTLLKNAVEPSELKSQWKSLRNFAIAIIASCNKDSSRSHANLWNFFVKILKDSELIFSC